MRAAGWDAGRPYYTGDDVTIEAGRGSQVLSLEIFSTSTAGTTYEWLSVRRATPGWVWPAGIVAGLLGAAPAWLVFGWASRRTAGRGIVKVTLGIALVLWWGPTAVSLGSFVGFVVAGHPGPQWPKLWEWLGQPVFSLPFLAASGLALLTLAMAALPPRHRAPTAAAA